MADVDKLLKRGLDFYGKGFFEEAVGSWRSVLEIDPNNEQAIDYLESAGVKIDPAESVKELVDKGLELFSAQDIIGARELWMKALSISPNDNRALAFLNALRSSDAQQPQAADGQQVLPRRETLPEPAPPEKNAKQGGIDKSEILALLKKKRFEEVLDKLRKEHAINKDDLTISRSIALVENRLTLEYANNLGNLEVVPVLSRPLSEMMEMKISKEEAFLLAQIDGTVTLQDIISISNLGHFETYRIINKYKNDGFIVFT